MVDTKRYWDGQRWTDHIAPNTSSPPAPTEGRGSTFSPNASRDDTSYVWALALLPVASIALDWLAPKIAGEAWVTFAFIGVVCGLIIADERRLKQNGIPQGPSVLWVLLVPVYLILRTIRVGSPAFIPIVWFATFGLSIWSTFASPMATDWNGSSIALDIKSQLSEDFDTEAEVECPSIKKAIEGDSVTCDVTAEDGTRGTVLVEFTNDGSYTWHVTQ